MAGISEVCVLLEKHKNIIIHELNSTNILTALVKRGILTAEDEELILKQSNETIKGDVFIDVIVKKGVESFKEFCYALETECPYLLSSILNDSSLNIGNYEYLFTL